MTQNGDSVVRGRYEAKLAEILDQRFNLQELRDLCFDLNVDFENIVGSTKREKIQELTKYFARRQVLGQFVAAIKGARPDIVIDPPAEIAAAREKRTYIYIARIAIHATGVHQKTLNQLTSISTILEAEQSALARRNSGTSETRISEGRQTQNVRVHSLTNSELVIFSFDDSVSLIHHVIDIATETKVGGDFTFRAGIHSAVLYIDPDNNDDPEVPNELINLTKYVMRLGKEGHILATSHAAETFKGEITLKGIVHDGGTCEIKYHVRVEIYNIYDEAGGKFGNPAKPNPIAPTRILKEINLPTELRCARPSKVSMTFSPEVSYAKVVFIFRNKDLQVSCEGSGDEDCTFDYYPSDENHTKVFEVWAIKADEETLEPVTIRFLDEEDEQMSPPVRGRVLVRRRTPDPAGWPDVLKIPLWIWDRFICLPIPLKALALIVALAAGGVYAAVKYDWSRYDQDKERLLIAVGFWPKRYIGPWPETFRDTNNHRPDPEKWHDPPQGWTLVDQEGRDPTDKALLVHGEQVGLNNIVGSALYDFKASLRFRILANERIISWILRAQNQGNYYLFVLTLPPRDGVKARIDGYIYSKGKQQGQLNGKTEELAYNYPFPENSSLFLDIDVRGSDFNHTFTSSLPRAFVHAQSSVPGQENDPDKEERYVKEDELLAKYFVGENLEADFTDPQNLYPWGYIGFRGLEPADEMKIEEVMITQAP